MEMIIKYREDKIKADFSKLQHELVTKESMKSIYPRPKDNSDFLERYHRRTLDLSVARSYNLVSAGPRTTTNLKDFSSPKPYVRPKLNLNELR